MFNEERKRIYWLGSWCAGLPGGRGRWMPAQRDGKGWILNPPHFFFFLGINMEKKSLSLLVQLPFWVDPFQCKCVD